MSRHTHVCKPINCIAHFYTPRQGDLWPQKEPIIGLHSREVNNDKCFSTRQYLDQRIFTHELTCYRKVGEYVCVFVVYRV